MERLLLFRHVPTFPLVATLLFFRTPLKSPVPIDNQDDRTRFSKGTPVMIIRCLLFLLKHHLAICEGGIALVYLSLAILSRSHRPHAVAYAAAAILAIILAACAAVAG
jgi:hypothetical protein